MMSGDELYGEILNRSEKIYFEWRENKTSSRKIRRKVESVIFKNERCSFCEKFAYFHALEIRIDEKYSSFWKKLFRYFSWKKELKLLEKIKKHIKCERKSSSRSIILQKIDDFANGENCFESANKNSDGIKVHGRPKENQIEKRKTKEEKNQNGEMKEVEPKNKESFEKQDDFVQETKTEKKKDKTKGSDKMVFHDINQEPVENKIVERENGVLPETTREKIVVPKQDLNRAEKIFKNEKIAIAEQEAKEKNVISKQTAEQTGNVLHKDEIFDELQKNGAFLQHKEEVKSVSPYEQVDKIEKTNFDGLNAEKKAENNIVNHEDKSFLQKNKHQDLFLEDQQKNAIIGEEISKISEKDMQLIKDVMQEELNRQMEIAEKNGEVFKMPLCIKEVLEPKTVEKSKVQSSQNSKPILKNDK